MKLLLTLILRTRCSGSPLLFPACLLLLSVASGCVPLNQTAHTKPVVSAKAESRTLLSDPPGHQRLIGFDSDESPEVPTGKTKVAVDDTENGSSSSQMGFCRILHQPEEVLTVSLEEPLLEDQQEPALVQISGYLQEDPLSGIEGDFECINPSLEAEFGLQPPSLWSRIKQDHAHYYSKESLLWLAGGFGAGAIVANTTLDGAIQSHLQSSLLGASSDEWLETFHAQKELGNGRYTLPVFAAAWGAGLLFEKVPVLNATGEWGERSIRAIIVGTPPMLLMQNVTGASRPGETTANSKWKFFQDDNGVSGHSFMGAIPFLAAAKVTDRPLLKVLFYAGSTLAPISRLNDNRHYPSQAFLGWYMAWIATNAVDATQHADRNWRMFPISWGGNTGVAFEYNW